MRYTLLEIVQIILNAMDSDAVNSIDDTQESSDVALLVKTVFYDLATDLQLPEHETLLELTASGDATKPVLMTVPPNVTRVSWIKYNNKLTSETNANYQEVGYMPFDQFIEMQNSLRNQTQDIGQMTFTNNAESFEIMYKTNEFPLWFTSMNDFDLIFNSYNSLEDTTLQKSKTMCYGAVYPIFTLSNTFMPDLDPTQFSLLINRAKVRAFAEKKQVQNVEAASETRRQKIIVQKRMRTVPNLTEIEKLPGYGRRKGTFTVSRKLRSGM